MDEKVKVIVNPLTFRVFLTHFLFVKKEQKSKV
jgi:hypothetical protein